jgi:hypothetical protein
MLDFYVSGNQAPMNAFMRSCLDPRIIAIMKEERPKQSHPGL